MLKLCVIALTITMAVSLPAKEHLDKATENDVLLNDILQENPSHKTVIIQEITSTATAKEAEKEESTSAPVTPKPKAPGSMFARLIDDIFQIPITVLQSVSKLLTNPFNNSHNKTPETASGY